ncbi:MAG: hypothetical protein IPL70_16010 [Uliginosibacterium sp.]|nr:hypothetical protein [Uliginosibacterium sp.]
MTGRGTGRRAGVVASAGSARGATLADFDAQRAHGETTNKLVGYLAAVSRKLDRPLGVVVQSSSAAGKTTLMDAWLAFLPEEDKVKCGCAP